MDLLDDNGNPSANVNCPVSTKPIPIIEIRGFKHLVISMASKRILFGVYNFIFVSSINLFLGEKVPIFRVGYDHKTFILTKKKTLTEIYTTSKNRANKTKSKSKIDKVFN